jgi:hypothetical protein
MVRVTDMDSWQRLFALNAQNSRWELGHQTIQLYLHRSFNYIIDLFSRVERSEPYALDPSGEDQLRLAKRVRREALRGGGEDLVRVEAARLFGLPVTPLRYEEQLREDFAIRAETDDAPRPPWTAAVR